MIRLNALRRSCLRMSSFLQFRLAGKKGGDATASRPLNQRYSKLHFIPESARNKGVFDHEKRGHCTTQPVDHRRYHYWTGIYQYSDCQIRCLNQ